MKKIIVITSLLLMGKAHAQLTLQSGSSITVTGNTLVTLQDVDLVNNGIINQTTGTGRFLFSGTANSTIGGNSNTTFDMLEVAKEGRNSVRLAQNININSSIQFTSGNIDLDRNNIDLQSSALLTGESEMSRINGASGGYIQITVPLNTPSSANPGNLGALISSSENLGTTVIRRGHVSQKAGGSEGNSIGRYYDIIPANDAAINVSLQMNYFSSELNGLAKNSLHLWKSANNKNWTKLDYSANSTAGNYAGKKEPVKSSRWTLFAEDDVRAASTFLSSKANDVSGKFTYTTADVKVYPNPVQEQLAISLSAKESTPLLIKVLDTKGATVFMQTKNLQQGGNVVKVDIKSLPTASYFLYLVWNNGQSKKTVNLVKQ